MTHDPDGPPDELKPVPRLLSDVQSIRVILCGPTPIMRMLRPRTSVRLFYGFGDESGAGYGKAIREAGNNCR